jgi:hypothetical protein
VIAEVESLLKPMFSGLAARINIMFRWGDTKRFGRMLKWILILVEPLLQNPKTCIMNINQL